MNTVLSIIIFIQIIIITNLKAQDIPLQKLDTASVLQNKSMQFQGKPRKKTVSVTDQIKLSLNNLMDRYIAKTNTPDTWKMLKNEADNILYSFFRSQQLVGSKPEQAYFVKIGNDTMTAADIKTGKMILLVGIAPVKPAEFEILTFERNVVGNY